MGEFGSVNNGDMQSRENYTRMARDLLEANGISWTYWEFGSTFGAYDPAKAMWIEPIRRALLD
jgi:endoglucanase